MSVEVGFTGGAAVGVGVSTDGCVESFGGVKVEVGESVWLTGTGNRFAWSDGGTKKNGVGVIIVSQIEGDETPQAVMASDAISKMMRARYILKL